MKGGIVNSSRGQEKLSHDQPEEIVLKALESRRSMARVRPEPPPRHLVERVIDAAVWAPNHYKTEPWHFFVLTGSSREELGNLMADSLRAKLAHPESVESLALIERQRKKPLRAPVVIAVAVIPSDRPKVRAIEEIAAVAAGVQNMLLAAEALGLGAMWRTGPAAYDPKVKEFFGLAESDHLLAFVYLGYPDDLPMAERSREAQDHTTWLG